MKRSKVQSAKSKVQRRKNTRDHRDLFKNISVQYATGWARQQAIRCTEQRRGAGCFCFLPLLRRSEKLPASVTVTSATTPVLCTWRSERQRPTLRRRATERSWRSGARRSPRTIPTTAITLRRRRLRLAGRVHTARAVEAAGVAAARQSTCSARWLCCSCSSRRRTSSCRRLACRRSGSERGVEVWACWHTVPHNHVRVGCKRARLGCARRAGRGCAAGWRRSGGARGQDEGARGKVQTG